MSEQKHPGNWIIHAEITARQYASIQLAVPDSGHDWLDDMIRERNRMDDERAAMQGRIANGFYDHVTNDATRIADMMAKQREKRRKE